MPEWCVRQATEVDHVGTGRTHRCGTVEDLVDRQGAGIDDLRENAHVVAREVEIAAAFAEIGGQVLQLVRTALEWDAERLGEALQIGAAAAWHDDAVGIDRPLQTPRDDGLGHKSCHLHADVEDRPFESKVVRAGEDLFQPCAREVSGQK